MAKSNETHTAMPKKLAQALMDSGMQHFDAGGLVGLVPGLGLGNNFQAQSVNNPANIQQQYGQQQDVYGQQQALASQLLAQTQGQGPGQQLIAQQGGANTAAQGAAMASARGASANPALVARNAALAGQQGNQQVLNAQSGLQLQSQNALAGQQAQMANQAIQGQSIGQGALASANNVNAGVSGQNASTNQGIFGGLLGGASAALGGLFNKGGEIPDKTTVMPKKLAQALMDAGVHHFDMGGSIGGSSTNTALGGASQALSPQAQPASQGPQGALGQEVNHVAAQSGQPIPVASQQTGPMAFQLAPQPGQQPPNGIQSPPYGQTIPPREQPQVPMGNQGQMPGLIGGAQGGIGSLLNKGGAVQNFAVGGQVNDNLGIAQFGGSGGVPSFGGGASPFAASMSGGMQAGGGLAKFLGSGGSGMQSDADAQAGYNHADSVLGSSQFGANAGQAGFEGVNAETLLPASGGPMADLAMFAASGGGKIPMGQMLAGGNVPGKAPIKGDSPKNDVVPTMLSPGEDVIPKSISELPEPEMEKKAVEFLKHLKKKKRGYEGVAEARGNRVS